MAKIVSIFSNVLFFLKLEFKKLGFDMELEFHKKLPLTWVIWIKKYHKELEFKKIKFLAIWYSSL